MFRFVIALPLLIVSTAVGAEPIADHVVLVSVDGFRPEFYLDHSWPAPVIQQMARDGAKAERVRSVFPSVTYPSHTTMVTGVMPAKHGVLFNNPFEPTGQTGRWYWSYDAVKTESLWTVLRANGLRTAAVSWPVTVGAPIDWVVPEVWSLEADSDRLGPMKDGTKPDGLWEELEREATGAINASTYSADYIGRDFKTAAAAAYLLETYKPSLVAMHLIGTDHFQHAEGRDGDIVRRSLAAADSAVNLVVEAADRAGIADRVAYIVTGDHGFVDVHTVVAPNVWLAEAGLMEARDDRGDWRATFHTAGGAAFLKLRDPKDRKLAARVAAIVDEQADSVRDLFRVVQRAELESIGADGESPLALAAKLGVAFSARSSGDAVSAGSGGTHGYFPSDFPEIYTGFVAVGAGIKAGVTVHEMGLEDVAPAIVKLLDLEMPSAEGIAPLGMFSK